MSRKLRLLDENQDKEDTKNAPSNLSRCSEDDGRENIVDVLRGVDGVDEVSKSALVQE